MAKSTGDEPIPQGARDHIMGLQIDLNDALATSEWQRRCISRLKAVIARCQDEHRAPTGMEVSEAMHDGTVRVAA